MFAILDVTVCVCHKTGSNLTVMEYRYIMENWRFFYQYVAVSW